MFRVAGIEPSPRMAVRERRLKDVAEFDELRLRYLGVLLYLEVY